MDIFLARPGEPGSFVLILLLLMLFFGTITGILHLWRWYRTHPAERLDHDVPLTGGEEDSFTNHHSI